MANQDRAFLYSNGVMQDLGALPGGSRSYANDISDTGLIVGWSYNAQSQARAALFTEGQVIDLNTLLPANSGWVLQQAFAINNFGQVTGTGTLDGQRRGFLLSGVPAPSTGLVMVVAACVNGRRRRPAINAD